MPGRGKALAGVLALPFATSKLTLYRVVGIVRNKKVHTESAWLLICALAVRLSTFLKRYVRVRNTAM